MIYNEVLHHRVGSVRMRIRMLITQQWICMGLTFGALACLALVAATKFQWWTDAMDYMWVPLVLGAGAGFIYGWTREITPLVAAQIVDERAGLKERLSTAVALSGQEQRSDLAEAQIADAARHAQGLRVGEVLPWRVPQQFRYLLAAIAILFAAIYVPELSIFHSQQEQADKTAMKLEGERIQTVAKKLEKELQKKKDSDKNDEILRKVAQSMKQLGKDQKLGRVSKKQAMLAMNDLQKQIKDAENKFGTGSGNKPVEKSAAELKQAAEQQAQKGNNGASKALAQMADNLSRKDLEGAKKQLEAMAEKMKSGKMTADEAKQTAEALQKMAESMDKSTLEKAASQLKDASKELQKAAEAAKQMQQQMASAKTDQERKQLQQQMGQKMSQAMQSAASQTQKAGGT